MEAAQRDYSNVSLDDYIKTNPQALKDIKVKTAKPRIRAPSQQWRLGRNGPRPLKRLMRYGPLRPLFPYRDQNFPRADDGLPKLVLKRYNCLSPMSVFHRLGWNPLHILAKQKLQQARWYFWRRRNQPQQRPWMFPWGRRRYGWSNRQRPMWSNRNFRQHNRNSQLFNVPNNINTQQLVEMQRLHIQARKLNRNNQGVSFHNQVGGPNRFNQMSVDPASLASEEAIRAYPIERDAYLPPLNRNVRPPSPVGSIISTLSKSNTNANPFARSNQQSAVNPFARPISRSSAHNPFASTTRGGIAGGMSNFNISLNSDYRPTPNTTNIPCSQRFTDTRNAVYQGMYLAG